jgi:hypothetical protein
MAFPPGAMVAARGLGPQQRREGGTVAVYGAGGAVAVIQRRRRRRDVVAEIQHRVRAASRR